MSLRTVVRAAIRHRAVTPIARRCCCASYHSTRATREALETRLTDRRDVPLPPLLKQRGDHLSRPSSRAQWVATGNEAVTAETLFELFNNQLSSLAVDDVLSAAECDRMVQIIETHDIDYYGEKVFPPIGCVGITQFENQASKTNYFSNVDKARSLQKRFMEEAGVDVVGRVKALLQSIVPPGLPVRLAQEDGKSYFAGLLRLINSSALIHADYGPFDGPGWEIGAIKAQLTWNILLKEVRGGESVVYNRFWKGKEDDDKYRDVTKSYGYSRDVIDGCESKKIAPIVGQIALFNPRNFHEVLAIENPEKVSRYTFSSFIGYLPPTAPEGPAIILWS